MKIAIIAGALLKKEMEDRLDPSGQGITWVWASEIEELDLHGDADLIIDLDFTLEEERVGKLSRFLPAAVMVNSVVHTTREIGRPFIRINAWPGSLTRNVHELVAPDEDAARMIAKLYEQLNWQYRIVPDIPGMISGRILAAIINEAYYTLQEKISTREEIDTAMRLGTNYPLGPFEWSERIGRANIYQLLAVLSEEDSRYIPSLALTQSLKKD